MNVEDFGKIPDWLAEAQRLEDARDAEKASDLARCQQLIADIRNAMIAASAIIDRQGDHDLATLLFDATGADDQRAKAARRTLEEDAGYIVGTKELECYP